MAALPLSRSTVYYKFKSAAEFCPLPIDGSSISVADLKRQIYFSARYGRGQDHDLIITNAQTNEDYVDDTLMIQASTSVLIRRIPHPPGTTIVVRPKDSDKEDILLESGTATTDSSVEKHPDDAWDDSFAAIHQEVPDQPSNQGTKSLHDDEEERKIKALANTPALDWQSQTMEAYGSRSGAGRTFSGKASFRFGVEALGFEKPPLGYICHRCKIPGHFIRECPTNGDPNFDIKRLKPTTGIPKSMLPATPEGSYSLPSGFTAVLKPNIADFEKAIQGIPSVCHASDLPPELSCAMCKQVMKDAVMSKCCFTSFCDRCIRDHIISKSRCICGAKDVLADDLLPNVTLRETINSIMVSKSTSSSSENTGSSTKDMGTTHHEHFKHPSAARLTERNKIPVDYSHAVGEDGKAKADNAAANSVGNNAKECADKLKALLEPTSQGNAPCAQEICRKLIDEEHGRERNKMKHSASKDAKNTKKAFQDLAAEYYVGMPFAPATFCPYWAANGMLLGFDGYAAPSISGMPYMSYLPGIYDVAVGGVLQEDPCSVHNHPFITQRVHSQYKERTGRDASPSKSQNVRKCEGDGDDESGGTKKRKRYSDTPSKFTGHKAAVHTATTKRQRRLDVNKSEAEDFLTWRQVMG